MAKILLSDWVRGKIPYFVLLLERPEEPDKAEEAKGSREEAKWERKNQVVVGREERLHGIGARQNLGSIVQKNTFVGDDVRPIEEVGGEDLEEESEGDVDEEEDESEEGDKLKWNEVFPEDAPPPRQSDDHASEDDDNDSQEEDRTEGMAPFLSRGSRLIFPPGDDDAVQIDEVGDAPAERAPRMTTNKVSLPRNQAKQILATLTSFSARPQISTRTPT